MIINKINGRVVNVAQQNKTFELLAKTTEQTPLLRLARGEAKAIINAIKRGERKLDAPEVFADIFIKLPQPTSKKNIF